MCCKILIAIFHVFRLFYLAAIGITAYATLKDILGSRKSNGEETENENAEDSAEAEPQPEKDEEKEEKEETKDGKANQHS